MNKIKILIIVVVTTVFSLLLLTQHLFCWYEPKHPLDNLYIRHIAPDGGFIWFGSQDIVSNHHGVFRYNRRINTWETFCKATDLPHNQIRNIEVFPDSVIIYTWEGAVVYRKSSKQWLSLKEHKYEKFPKNRVLGKGYVYEIDGDSLIVLREGVKTVFKFPANLVEGGNRIKKYELRNIFYDDNKLWFGVDAVEFEPCWFGIGIGCFNLSSKEWSFFQPNCLKHNSISCITKDLNSLWFGTAQFTEDGDFPGVGAIQFNKMTDQWKQFSKENSGIAGNAVFAILIDGDDIWFGTNRGISRYDKAHKQWRTYGITDWTIAGDSVKIYAGDGHTKKDASPIIGTLLQSQTIKILSKRYNWYEIQLSQPITGWIPADRIEVKKDTLGNVYGIWKGYYSKDMIPWDDCIKTGPGNEYTSLFHFEEKWHEQFALGKKQNGWQQMMLSTGWINEKNVKCLISEIQ